MPLPIPVKDVKGEPALGQSLREAFRRSVDGTGYAKIIGPLEIIKDLVVQGLIRCKDILTNNLNVLGMISTNNLDATGSVSAERLSVSSRAVFGEAEVFGVGYFNKQIQVATFAELPQVGDQAAPASARARLYVRDNGAGKTQLVVRFPTGAVQVIATEP